MSRLAFEEEVRVDVCVDEPVRLLPLFDVDPRAHIAPPCGSSELAPTNPGSNKLMLESKYTTLPFNTQTPFLVARASVRFYSCPRDRHSQCEPFSSRRKAWVRRAG